MAKDIKILIIALLSLSTLFSCGFEKGSSSDYLPSSSGKYGEVLVVLDTSYESGPIGQTLDDIFFKAVEGTPQREPQFRMSTVDTYSFKSILKRSRNLLKLSINRGNKNTVKVDKDVWANDQLLINISADSEESALRILAKNEQSIRDYFNNEELKRLKKQFSIQLQKDLTEKLEAQYQLSIIIPPAFRLMESNETSFWIKKEKTIGQHQIIQGLMVYFFPYTSDTTFENNTMIHYRNLNSEFLVTGTRDSSHMQVYEEYAPNRQEVNLNGSYAVEYRGLWNMKNDFMGGGFIHYTFVDEARSRVVNLDGFVYAPKFNKREYLRELEAMMKSVELSKAE